jgi:hypothetical protein
MTAPCILACEKAARDLRVKRPELIGADLILMQSPTETGDWVLLHHERRRSKEADKVLCREGNIRTDCYLGHVGPTDVVIGWLSRGRVEEPDYVDDCEWDPATDRPAPVGIECHARAELIVGAKGEWRLCRSCADLPHFKKYRKRVEVRR